MFRRYIKDRYLVAAFPGNQKYNFISIIRGKWEVNEKLIQDTIKGLAYLVETMFDFERIQEFRDLEVEAGISKAPKSMRKKLKKEYVRSVFSSIKYSPDIQYSEHFELKASISRITKKDYEKLQYLMREYNKTERNIFYFNTMHRYYTNTAEKYFIEVGFIDFLHYHIFDADTADEGS